VPDELWLICGYNIILDLNKNNLYYYNLFAEIL